MDENEPTRKRERVDLVRLDNLEGNREHHVRTAGKILPQTVYVFRDDRVIDNPRLLLNFYRQLFAEGDLLLHAVEVDAARNLAVADRFGVFFPVFTSVRFLLGE